MKKQVKFYYVYLIINNVTNKQYIGSRMCYKNHISEDNYMGTSKYLDEDYQIYGQHNFTKQILKDDYQNSQEMLNGESEYMLKLNTLAPNGYNRFLPNIRNGFHMAGYKRINSEETKHKMSIAKTGKKLKPMSEEQKQKISQSLKGFKCSEQTKINMSKGQKGKIYSQETKKKLSEMRLGKPHPHKRKSGLVYKKRVT